MGGDSYIPFEDIPWWMSSDTRLPERVANRLGFIRDVESGLLIVNYRFLRDDLEDNEAL